jgi:hypothetical protein
VIPVARKGAIADLRRNASLEGATPDHATGIGLRHRTTEEDAHARHSAVGNVKRCANAGST